jgi:TPR repeat protein
LNRTYLPLAVAGVFAIVVLGALAFFVMHSQPLPPSQEELAGDYAKGVQYERGQGVMTDYGQAIAWYRKAAEGGYPQAEYAMAVMTEAGHGVIRDPKAAIEWFRRAAEHGQAEAQVRLAGEYLTGAASADGKPDKIEALKWLLLGAEGMPDPLGSQVAIVTREKLYKEMGPEERFEAGRRTDEWRKQHNPQPQ